MNLEFAERLAQALERDEMPPGHRFDMADFGYETDCGTAGCIAGTAIVMAGGDLLDNSKHPRYEAAKHLAVEPGEVYSLFLPLHLNLEEVTPQQAAKALRNFMAGNRERPWDGVLDEPSAPAC